MNTLNGLLQPFVRSSTSSGAVFFCRVGLVETDGHAERSEIRATIRCASSSRLDTSKTSDSCASTQSTLREPQGSAVLGYVGASRTHNHGLRVYQLHKPSWLHVLTVHVVSVCLTSLFCRNVQDKFLWQNNTFGLSVQFAAVKLYL